MSDAVTSSEPRGDSRETRLERRVREAEEKASRARILAGLSLIGLIGLALMGIAQVGRHSSDQLRTQRLIIEDSTGRQRIVIGAPISERRPRVGMKIQNSEGAEQFGLGLDPDGSMSMGFDVKPGVGNPANRERLNLGVNPTGQGGIRFLDNQTRARMWVRLDSSGAPLVEFWRWNKHSIAIRQVRFGETDTKFISR